MKKELPSFITGTTVNDKVYKIEGEYDFHLKVSINGTALYQNTNIYINAFSNTNKNIPVPVKYTWHRIHGDRAYLL